MKNASFSSIEDFLEDPSFRSAVFRKNEDDVRFWKAFLAENPQFADQAGEAHKILLSIRGELPEVSQEEINSAINSVITRTRPSPKTQRHGSRYWLKIAASLALAVCVGWGLNSLFEARKGATPITAHIGSDHLNTVVNNTNRPKLVRFPDGSSAMLSPNSMVRFVKEFNTSRREVSLSGEAFFEVSKNPQWPFVVQSNELITQVVGTSFLISAYPDSKTFEVRVKTGKVELYQKEKTATSPKKPTSITLVENEQATLNRKDGIFIEGKQSAERKSQTEAFNGNFQFRRTRISDVFTLLERSYNIKIIYDRDVIKTCTLTASLTDEPLQEKLNMITASIDASYQISGDTVRVTSLRPCN